MFYRYQESQCQRTDILLGDRMSLILFRLTSQLRKADTTLAISCLHPINEQTVAGCDGMFDPAITKAILVLTPFEATLVRNIAAY